VEQITKDIYIGGITTREAVKYKKIKTVINLVGDSFPYKSDKMPIKDGRTNDPKQFFRIMQAIDVAIKERRTPVFINCAAGISRSPIIASLYLYRSGKGKYASFGDALEFVLSKSTVAQPSYKLIDFVKKKAIPYIDSQKDGK
jgi:protein-tyrosine phosphatase